MLVLQRDPAAKRLTISVLTGWANMQWSGSAKTFDCIGSNPAAANMDIE